MDFKHAPAFNEERRSTGMPMSERTFDLHYQLSRLTDRMMTLLVSKMEEYGNDRFEDHPLDFDAWVSFVDVYRKFTRAEQMTRAIAASDGQDEELMDMALEMYGDLMGYALISLYHMCKHHPDEAQFMMLQMKEAWD